MTRSMKNTLSDLFALFAIITGLVLLVTTPRADVYHGSVAPNPPPAWLAIKAGGFWLMNPADSTYLVIPSGSMLYVPKQDPAKRPIQRASR